MFWLDVEHYKHFDGSRDDLKLLANCIIIKYMADMAEIPVDLPSEMVVKITKEVELNTTQGNAIIVGVFIYYWFNASYYGINPVIFCATSSNVALNFLSCLKYVTT